MKNHWCKHRDQCHDYNINHCEGCGEFETVNELLAEMSKYPSPIKQAVDSWMTNPLPKAAYVGVGRSNGKTDVLDALKYTIEPISKLNIHPDITNVKFNPPATIVFWSDNTKTVVKAQDGEPFDPEKGLAMAMIKKYLGNKGNYFNEINKWTKDYYKQQDILKDLKEAMERMHEPSSVASVSLEHLSNEIKNIFVTKYPKLEDPATPLSHEVQKILMTNAITPMDIFVETGADLAELINNVKYHIENYGVITVEDYYDLAGYVATDDPQNEKYNVSKYGWTELPAFGTTFDEDGFLLKAPKAKLLM